MKYRPWPSEAQTRPGREPRGFPVPPRLPLPFANRLSGVVPYFQGAHDPANVIGMQSLGGHRVHRRKSCVKRLAAVAIGFRFDLATQFLIRRRRRKKSAQESFEVERRPADEQGNLSARLNIG